jgi:hypothetical protein
MEGLGAVEPKLRKVGPEAAPGTADGSGARSSSGRPETGENLEEQVLREAADPVL